MPVICPAILAPDEQKYHSQIEKIAGFAHRIQIDLTDGVFTQANTVKPDTIWWPAGVKADIHLMYKLPLRAAQEVLRHQPNLVIVHAEAEGDFGAFSDACRQAGAKIGVALLQPTSPEAILPSLGNIDHVLIF